MTLARADVAERLFGGLFTVFGLSALLLAVVGLAGLLGFAVSQRTRELGIRVALGGRPAAILWLVLRGGAIQLLLGLAIGLGLAAAVAPQLGEALFEQKPHDPVVYAAIAVLLITAAHWRQRCPPVAPCASVRWSHSVPSKERVRGSMRAIVKRGLRPC